MIRAYLCIVRLSFFVWPRQGPPCSSIAQWFLLANWPGSGKFPLFNRKDIFKWFLNSSFSIAMSVSVKGLPELQSLLSWPLTPIGACSEHPSGLLVADQTPKRFMFGYAFFLIAGWLWLFWPPKLDKIGPNMSEQQALAAKSGELDVQRFVDEVSKMPVSAHHSCNVWWTSDTLLGRGSWLACWLMHLHGHTRGRCSNRMLWLKHPNSSKLGCFLVCAPAPTTFRLPTGANLNALPSTVNCIHDYRSSSGFKWPFSCKTWCIRASEGMVR